MTREEKEACDTLVESLRVENAKLGARLFAAELAMGRMRSALELVATPMRRDGTYNRDRKACELLAKEALDANRDA